MTPPRATFDRADRVLLVAAASIAASGALGVWLAARVPAGSVLILGDFDHHSWSAVAWCVVGLGPFVFAAWAFRRMIRSPSRIAQVLALFLMCTTFAMGAYAAWFAMFMLTLAGSSHYVDVEADDGTAFRLHVSTWHHTRYTLMESDRILWRSAGHSVFTDDPDRSIATGEYSLSRLHDGYLLQFGPDLEGRSYRLAWPAS